MRLANRKKSVSCSLPAPQKAAPSRGPSSAALAHSVTSKRYMEKGCVLNTSKRFCWKNSVKNSPLLVSSRSQFSPSLEPKNCQPEGWRLLQSLAFTTA